MRISELKIIGFLLVACCLLNCVDREGCTDPASDNFNINAEVDNGTCIPMTAKFLGLYDVEEECEFGSYVYPMSIYASFRDPFEIIITNFGDLSIDVYAIVDRNYITIPDQIIIQDGNEIAILEGTGDIIDGSLIIDYLYGQNGSEAFICQIDALQI